VLALAACRNDGGLTPFGGGKLALTAGDFDDVEAPFDRMVVATDAYEGLISTATWDPSYEPGNVALKVEDLLGSGSELRAYHGVFVASGTRGLGLREYNGLDPDDEFVANEDVLANVDDWTKQAGNILWCTDWSYDLVEQAFPDELDFLGDDTTFDAAQTGAIGTITAHIEDDRLSTALDEDDMAVNFDFSNWAVPTDVADDVTVWLKADEVTYRVRDGEGDQSATDVPLLVSFNPHGPTGGRVIFSAFHLDAQTPEVTDELIRTVFGKLDENEGEPVDPIQ